MENVIIAVVAAVCTAIPATILAIATLRQTRATDVKVIEVGEKTDVAAAKADVAATKADEAKTAAEATAAVVDSVSTKADAAKVAADASKIVADETHVAVNTNHQKMTEELKRANERIVSLEKNLSIVLERLIKQADENGSDIKHIEAGLEKK